MSTLATMMFILAPFALVCADYCNGMVLCIIFLILGGIFKWIGNGGLKPKMKVAPKDWWETNYRINMAQGRGHKSSVEIANYTTKSNRCPMPTEEKKEEVAKSLGVITEKMRREEEDKWNRIQAEKYRLMEQLYKKYKNIEFRSDDYVYGKRQGRVACPDMYIKYSMLVLEGFIHKARYSKTDPWSATLSDEEKEIAKKWIEEYEERLIKEVNDYVHNGIQMPTITKHRDRGGWARHSEYDVKYGFCREEQF